MSEQGAEWHLPEGFEEYVISREIGRGGMGAVYLARDSILDRNVAIKFIAALHPDFGDRERFLREARLAARLHHPNVVSVFRVGELDGRPFIVSEFVEGRSLSQIPTPVPPAQVVDVALQLARGLAAAHRRGVVHRDVKPANVVLRSDGVVKILDFGIAKLSAVDGDPGRSSSIPPPSAPAAREAPAVVIREASYEVVDPREALTLPASSSSGAVARSRSSGPALTWGRSVPPPPLTAAGARVGTPRYMAPEVWEGRSATPRSDVYGFGAIVFELASGRHPFGDLAGDALREAASSTEPPPVGGLAPGLSPPVAAVVDRCLRRDPSERFASAEALLLALEEAVRGPAPPATAQIDNPYRGLLPFLAEHRAAFFGRQGEVRAVVERLKTQALVLVTGGSGIGKSSLCEAGVLPLVVDGALGQGRTWTVCRVPLGREPAGSLAAVLAATIGRPATAVEEALFEQPEELARDVGRWAGRERGLVLFVDALEDLHLQAASAEHAEVFAEGIAELAVGMPAVRVLGTIRSDQLARVATLPGIGREIGRALSFLRPMSDARIREAIEGPAKQAGVTFESPELVDALAAAGEAEGGLPVLQFALAELWERRDRRRAVISRRSLDEIGGVEGSLSRHADGVLASLPGNQRAAARRLLLALLDADRVRLEKSGDALVGGDPDAGAALSTLVAGRLVAAREVEGVGVYRIAHEALVRGWPLLDRWVADRGESRAVRERLEAAAVEWERLGRTREALWGRSQLGEAARLELDELGLREREFVLASRRGARRARAVRLGAVAAVPLLLALAFAGSVWSARAALDRSVHRRLGLAERVHRAARVERDALLAERRRAFAHFDTGDLPAGESAWDLARALQLRTLDRYERASQAAEAAVAIDPDRPSSRRALARILFERLQLARLLGDARNEAELLRRLPLYDREGRLVRQASAPATLSIRTDRPGVRVAVRTVRTEGRLLTPRDARDLGRSPVAATPLPAGSYVLELAPDGGTALRVPLRLRANERLALRVALPEPGAVPAGHRWVAPGRYLVGSTSDDTMRRQFLLAEPQHEVTADRGFVMAVTETTYQEWIEFLESLPVTEQARHGPRLLGLQSGGTVVLERGPQGWTLSFGAMGGVEQGSTAVRRLGPERFAEWAKLPVTGVRLSSIEAFARWADRTGRLPGARLCTDREWEHAVRGADGRAFPASTELRRGDAAVWFPGDDTTDLVTAVGEHPASRSIAGIDDLAGNAWEIVRGPGDPPTTWARGGGRNDAPISARADNRLSINGEQGLGFAGFRLCADLPARP